MIRLRGHYDGTGIVLDEPIPSGVAPNTSVEVVLLATRDQVLANWQEAMREWWDRPLTSQPHGRTWRREDLYERC